VRIADVAEIDRVAVVAPTRDQRRVAVEGDVADAVRGQDGADGVSDPAKAADDDPRRLFVVVGR
jgi:hypothetical protein